MSSIRAICYCILLGGLQVVTARVFDFETGRATSVNMSDPCLDESLSSGKLYASHEMMRYVGFMISWTEVTTNIDQRVYRHVVHHGPITKLFSLIRRRVIENRIFDACQSVFFSAIDNIVVPIGAGIVNREIYKRSHEMKELKQVLEEIRQFKKELELAPNSESGVISRSNNCKFALYKRKFRHLSILQSIDKALDVMIAENYMQREICRSLLNAVKKCLNTEATYIDGFTSVNRPLELARCEE